jgi:hypothetical protein
MKTVDWRALTADLESPNVSTCVRAAEALHANTCAEDVPRLLELLKHESFFVREAAAWPLAELQGPLLLPQLLVAYQRGFDEGYDNDGFTAALLEIPALHPEAAPVALKRYISTSTEPLRGHAEWLLQFCAVNESSTVHDA